MSTKHTFEERKIEAKKVPMVNLYPWELKRAGDLLRGFCPFHEDTKTPNFYIYPKTNSWFCFAGCGGGDSINFYMRLRNIDFKKAVRELTI